MNLEIEFLKQAQTNGLVLRPMKNPQGEIIGFLIAPFPNIWDTHSLSNRVITPKEVLDNAIQDAGKAPQGQQSSIKAVG